MLEGFFLKFLAEDALFLGILATYEIYRLVQGQSFNHEEHMYQQRH